MDLKKEYVEKEEDVIKRNFNSSVPIEQRPRHLFAKSFCSGFKNILCIGSGGMEPFYLNASHACDISKVSLNLLTPLGWKGSFKVCSCDDLPYKNKEFDVAFCLEVIEHLTDIESVKKTFKEIDRVSRQWLVSTPNSSIIKRKHQDPAHRLFFNEPLLKKIIKVPYHLFKHEYHFYITNCPEKFTAIIKKKMNNQLALEALIIIKKCLSKVKWFLDAGTLLGAVREGDFIGYDYDIDLGCLPEFWNQVNEIAENLKKSGFTIEVHKDWEGHKDRSFIQFYYHGIPGHISFNWPKGKRLYHVDKLLNEVGPVRKIRGVEFPVPFDPELYLSKSYKDWKVPNKTEHATLNRKGNAKQ